MTTEAFQKSGGTTLALLAALGFSFKAILVKLAYPYGVDAVTLLALRMVFALPFFLLMAGMHQRRNTVTPAVALDSRSWFAVVALGFLGYYLSSLLDFQGLRYISAGLERLILFLYPTLVVLFSAFFLGKPITRRILAALCLSYAGIFFAVFHDIRLSDNNSEIVLGALLVFGSAVSYSLYLMGSGIIVGRIGAMRLTAYASTVACLLCIAQFGLTRSWDALALPWQVYGLSVAMALFSTVMPVWCISEAISRMGAGKASLLGSLGPVITIFLGWLLLNEPFSFAQVVGAVLVLAGVMLVSRK